MIGVKVLLFFCLVLPAFAGDLPGVGNFHEVNAHVYRGAQPKGQGFGNLAKLGVAVVVDLREPGKRSALEEKFVRAAGMRYINVPMKGLGAPSSADIAKVLALLEDESTGAIFVHCRRGSDRTGTVLAVYRIRHDGWENRKALSEARSLGMSRLERSMQAYILNYKFEHPHLAVPAGQ